MNLLSLRNEWKKGKRHEFVLFWKPDEVPYGVFCQWHESPFKDGFGTKYDTAEHYMMMSKASLFHDLDALQKIFETKDPREVKRIGRSVKDFDKKLWEINCHNFVYTGNLFKFSNPERPDLKDILLSTGDKVLVEASPYDNIWGIKLSADDPDAFDPLKWKGTNRLGFALMDVRDTLRGE